MFADKHTMNQLETKKYILHALESNDLDTVVAFIQENRKVLSLLIRMAYDKETLVGWRAIKAVGRIARALVKTDNEFLHITIRKLLWSLSDESGGIGWAAPELLGEIVSADPEGFADIIPLITEVYDIEEQTFRPGVVYALARIAEVSPEPVTKYQKVIIKSLADENPLLKIYALDLVGLVWPIACRKKLWSQEYKAKIYDVVNSMKNHKGVAWIYQNSSFTDAVVGEKSTLLAKSLN